MLDFVVICRLTHYMEPCQSISRFPSESFKKADGTESIVAIGPSIFVSLFIFSARWNLAPRFLSSFYFCLDILHYKCAEREVRFFRLPSWRSHQPELFSPYFYRSPHVFHPPCARICEFSTESLRIELDRPVHVSYLELLLQILLWITWRFPDELKLYIKLVGFESIVTKTYYTFNTIDAVSAKLVMAAKNANPHLAKWIKGFPIVPAAQFSSCPIETSLGVLGKKWTMLVLRDIAMRKMERFSDLMKSIPGITPRMLSARLREMEQSWHDFACRRSQDAQVCSMESDG